MVRRPPNLEALDTAADEIHNMRDTVLGMETELRWIGSTDAADHLDPDLLRAAARALRVARDALITLDTARIFQAAHFDVEDGDDFF